MTQGPGADGVSAGGAGSAPPWQVERWFNTEAPLDLATLRGKVVVLEAFQMLCPGCVAHGLPLAQRIHESFPRDEVAVVGLHTVFEHHAAMTPTALEAFLHEYRIRFPVGVDAPGAPGGPPRTMLAYGLRGTPSLLLIDREGVIRSHWFGRPAELIVGAGIATLLAEGGHLAAVDPPTTNAAGRSDGCDDTGCAL
ncbi:MAG: redoxin domain-containing protein [Alphaproteobacteria bacterium]|nr:redoxin domain-containing protein [Alphaproteobacteria bacterium]